MRTETAIKICAEWHGGQWSPLYQFASTGTFYRANVLQYFQEIETCLHPEYNLHPSQLSKKDERNLTGLKNYFIRLAKVHGYEIEFKTHSMYGYLIPYIKEGNAAGVKELHYAI